MKKTGLMAIIGIAMVLTACAGKKVEMTKMSTTESAQAFLDHYTQELIPLYYESAEAQWVANIEIIEGDTTNATLANEANEAFAKFTGSIENIEMARKFLGMKEELEPIQVLQLEEILYAAANNPATVPELVKARIAAETAQEEQLFGFDFVIDGESVSTNQIDAILRDSDDLAEKLKAWEVSKEVGVELKSGLNNLVGLRNETVQALGYDDFFQYQVSDYGMTTQEMIDLMDKFNKELRPLYRELHTYWRYELAKKYNQPVPEQLPAHWLPNRWGQDWSPLVTVEGADLNAALADKTPEWLVKQAEDFFVSLGYSPLPATFYEKSSLYPLPPDATYKKNNHA